MPGKASKNSYILPHNLSGERQRLALMSELLDPMHRALLERIGLRPGWRCLEIGCGNGSISQWLAAKVGCDAEHAWIAGFLAPLRCMVMAASGDLSNLSADQMNGIAQGHRHQRR